MIDPNTSSENVPLSMHLMSNMEVFLDFHHGLQEFHAFRCLAESETCYEVCKPPMNE